MTASQPIDDLMNLLRISGLSGEEDGVIAHVLDVQRQLGPPAATVRRDESHRRSEYGGAAGNLAIHLPRRGGHTGGGRLFLAHLDKVALAREAKPRLVPGAGGEAGRIVNDNHAAALGGDDRTGVAVLLHILRTLAAGNQPHPPVTLVFTVQEEVGLIGARELDVAALAPERPALGFGFDSGNPAHLIHAITGAERFFIEIRGRAAHAGLNPQDGVSCAVVFAKALADLAGSGWHGRIRRPEGCGTANIGVLQGGVMTNTVMDRLAVRGEARSHDAAFRARTVAAYRAAFERAAAGTRNTAGESAHIEWTAGPSYEAFALPETAPVVQLAKDCLRGVGLEPVLEKNDGGMDANWLNAHGIPTVMFGCGQRSVHTTAEWIDVADFLTACRLAERLATE